MNDEIVDVEAVEDEVRHLPAVRQSEAIVARAEISVDEVVAQKDKIVQVMQAVMREDVHYGKIPGVAKPSLLKPGAESINVALRLAPHYVSDKIFSDDGHLTVTVQCELRHIPTGLVVGTGEGLCSSRESKYAYRNAKRSCPKCGTEAIIKGKEEYGGGWLCWKKEGGCGAKFAEKAAEITAQEVGKVANPDLPDTWNTVLKMADKRALVAAVLNATAASDVFTQDVEETAAPRAQREDAGEPSASAAKASAAEQPTSEDASSASPATPPQEGTTAASTPAEESPFKPPAGPRGGQATLIEASELAEKLIVLVNELGAVDSLPMVEQKREAGDIAWLKRQITTASKALERRASEPKED